MTDAALSTLPWQPAERAQIDRGADYIVSCNDGALEVQSGTLLWWRLRPEFVVGRPITAARIDWNDWERT